VRDENSSRRFTIRRDIINENLTLNARCCGASITTVGTIGRDVNCIFVILNVTCHMCIVYLYIKRVIFTERRNVRVKSARGRYHRAVSLCTLPAWIKIPDKGIRETEMDLQSVLRKVANFLRRNRLPPL